MAVQLSFKQDAFNNTGIALYQSEWTLAQCGEQAQESGEVQFTQLGDFALELGCTDEDVILSCYKGGDGKTYFALPSVMRDKEGVLSLSFGKMSYSILATEITETLKNKQVTSTVHTVNGVTITPTAIRDREDNTKITGVRFTFATSIDLDGLTEDVEFNIPIRIEKDSDYKAILLALKAGETPEAIRQMSTGFRLTIKPYMLPPSAYKLLSYKTPPTGEWAGKIWSGDCRDVATDVTFSIELSTKPFKDNQAFRSICGGGVTGKGVYFVVGGAFDMGDNKTSTLIDAKQLTEVNGVVEEGLWSRFMEMANATINATRTSNQGKILSAEQIAEKREALEAKQMAKLASRAEAKNGTVPTGNTLAKNPEAAEGDFDEIPF
jgi:hypothetical protein